MQMLEVPEIVEPKPIWLKEHEEHLNFAGYTVVTMGSYLGKIEIKVCLLCGYEDVSCLHINVEVDTRLITMNCKLCGG